jgi:methionyl aminopeptidase
MALRSEQDIAGIRRAGSVVANALAAASAACVPGVTTADIDAVVRATIESAGGEPLFLGYRGSNASNMGVRPAYPASSCISVNEQLVHGVPGSRVIREGDIVSIDAGARVDGWCADSAVSVCVGCVTADACALVDCAEDMLARAITSIRPGIRWSMVAREIEAIAVGRALHEAPQVPCSVYASFLEGGDFTLRPGLVLAIEPMVVLESPRRNDRGELVNPSVTLADDGWTVVVDSGAPSCHVEHTVAVTRDGAEVLTSRSSANRSRTRDVDEARCTRRVG